MSGLISYSVDQNPDGHLNRKSWEWFFLIEGVLTVTWGLLVLGLLPKLPETVAQKGSIIFREQEERDLILKRTTAARNTPDAKASHVPNLLGVERSKNVVECLDHCCSMP